MDSSVSVSQEQLDPPPLPPLPQQGWERPPAGFVKLNFDSGRCTPVEVREALAAWKILELAVAMKFFQSHCGGGLPIGDSESHGYLLLLTGECATGLRASHARTTLLLTI
ncbi:hypothetical protein M569_10754 [Genlisea aurea]|uniref:Uncharacterized protein n=1 Tax=Genlisea aurea TaxID=192259 RepID=S8DM18_9LAMI|nr:hypothetical protein M569_10754 [Genlisea aurea]